MNRYLRQVIHHRGWVIALSLLVTLGALYSAAGLRVVIDPAAILPQSHRYVASKSVLEGVFGEKYTLVVTLTPKAGPADTPAIRAKVQALTDALLAQRGVVRHMVQSLAAPNTKAIESADDGIRIRPFLEALADGRPLATLLAANPLYRQLIASDDGRTVAVFAQFEPDPQGYGAILRRVTPAIDALRDNSVSVHVGGHVAVLGELELYSERMILLLPLAIVLIGLVHFEAFRSVQGLVLPLVTATLALIWVLGIMGLSGIPLDVFNATTPILILAVAAGHAVQILKRYYEEYDRLIAAGHPDPRRANEEAVVLALDKVGRYMVVASLIAALGFLSLTIFEIRTVKTFGIFTGLGILSALVIELSFIPALRAWLPPPRQRAAAQSAPRPSIWLRLTEALADRLHGKAPFVFWGAVVAVALLGLPRVQIENSNRSNFAPWTELRRDDAAINSALAGSQVLYLMIDSGVDGGARNPSLLRGLDRLQQQIAAWPDVGRTVSIVDVLKRINQALIGEDAAHFALPTSSAQVSQYLLLYGQAGDARDLASHIDFNERWLNLKIFVKRDDSTRIEALIAHAAARAQAELPPGTVFSFGGGVAEAAALNEVLVHDKLLNIAQIGGVVFVIASLVFRSASAGLLVMLPLLVAVLVNFGLLGWLGIPLNVPTSLISAMTVGIGADYAIYLIARFREEVRSGTADPLRATVTTAGQACLYVATAVAVGYGVLGLSFGFYIHQWMALLIAAAMSSSALAALTLIPAWLAWRKPRWLAEQQLPSNASDAMPQTPTE